MDCLKFITCKLFYDDDYAMNVLGTFNIERKPSLKLKF